MSDEFPDCATIHAVLSLATRAPSVRNAQPWRWRVDVDTDVLHLHADPVGQLPHTDADERDVLISCGASLHHGVAALAALGWAAKVHRLPDPDDAHHLAALRVHPHPAADLDTGWPRRYRSGAPTGASTANGQYRSPTSRCWVPAPHVPE